MSRSRVSYDDFEGQPSPASSDDRSLERQASVRIGRTGARVSIARSSRGGGSSSPTTPPQGGRQRSSRVRRSTPVARKSASSRRQNINRSSALTDEEEFADEMSPMNSNNNINSSSGSRSRSARGRRSRMQADIETNNGRTRRTATLSTTEANTNPDGLSWYERLLPEFLLSLSAPITGYEDRLDSDIDDEEYEILERQRLKRNKRIRRRLFTVMLIATAAGAFIYTRGRMFRKVGVKAAMSTMKHRLEDGFAKSIQETMGK